MTNEKDAKVVLEVVSKLAADIEQYKKTLTREDKVFILHGKLLPTKVSILPKGTFVEYPQINEKNLKGSIEMHPSSAAVQRALQELKKLGSLKPVQDIISRCGIDSIRSEMDVATFVTHALAEQSTLDDLVDIFVGEITTSPTNWDVSLYLLGLSIPDEPLLLGDCTLRKPTSSDFVEEVSLVVSKDQGDQLSLPSQSSRLFPFDAIVDWELLNVPRGFEHEGAIVDDVKRVLYEMRLLKAGQYRTTGWNARCDGLTRPHNLYETQSPQDEMFLTRQDYYSDVYHPTLFKLKDEEKHRILSVRAFSRIGIHGNVSNRVQVALWALNEAASHTPIEALLFIIIGLEALFLSNEAELRLKLSLRTAAMLTSLGGNSSEVYDDIWNAYRIRSKIVHGGATSQAYLTDARRLLPRITEFLRKAILCWLQINLRTKGDVERFQGRLETFFLCAESESLVREKLSEVSV